MAMTASVPGFDTLAYARRLKEAGVAEAQAEAHAEAVRDAITEGVATKADIARIEDDIARIEDKMATKADLGALRADLGTLRADFYRALLVLGAALVGIMVAVAGGAIGLMQALG